MLVFTLLLNTARGLANVMFNLNRETWQRKGLYQCQSLLITRHIVQGHQLIVVVVVVIVVIVVIALPCRGRNDQYSCTHGLRLCVCVCVCVTSHIKFFGGEFFSSLDETAILTALSNGKHSWLLGEDSVSEL